MPCTLPVEPPPRQGRTPLSTCRRARWRRWHAASWLLALCGACEQPTRPWSAAPDAGVVTHPKRFLPAKQQPQAPVASTDGPASAAAARRRPSRVGGLWVSCYGGFKPSGKPLVDVTRLGLLCGPSNGMTQHGEVARGEVAPGEVATVALKAVAGSCYRVFAAAGTAVKDLDVVVRSPRGKALARDDSHDSWPIVEPERPLCALESGTYSVQLSAAEAGPFALAIWQLSATGSR